MNTQDTQFELMRRCLDDVASKEESAELECLLREDADFRKEYLRYLNVDLGLRALPGKSSPQQRASRPSTSRPFTQWRPFTSAAAGLVIGFFCASVAWAIVSPRSSEAKARAIIPLLTESFENSATPLVEGFPTEAGRWGGDRAQIVRATSEHRPVDGDSLLRVEPSPETTLSYLQQILEVESLPLADEGEARTLEVSASFLAEKPGKQERYTLRVATFDESPEQVRELWEDVPWREMDENTLTMTKSGLSTSEDAEGWQTVSVSVKVPATARSVVISLAAGRLDPLAPKTFHYLDDIRADLVIASPKKRSRKKRS